MLARTQRQRPKRSSARLMMVLQPESSVKRRRSARAAGARGGLCLVSMPSGFTLVPLAAADCSPSPSRIVAQNLIYLLQAAPLAVPGELLQHTKGPQRAAPPQMSLCSSSLFPALLQTCRAVPFLLLRVLRASSPPCVARPVSSAREEGAPFVAAPHSTASCSLANISNPDQSLLLTTCSLPQCLAASVCIPEVPVALQPDHGGRACAATIARTVHQFTSPPRRDASSTQQPGSPRTVHYPSCTRISQARLRQRSPQLTTADHNPRQRFLCRRKIIACQPVKVLKWLIITAFRTTERMPLAVGELSRLKLH